MSAGTAPDARIDLHLSAAEQARFLASMQVMLGSVQGILRGVATHDRKEITVRAETDDMDMLAGQAAKLMNQCMACHAQFRVH